MGESFMSPLMATMALLVVPVAFALVLAVEVPGAVAIRRYVSDLGQVTAFVIAGAAMAGSLYYSEVVGFVPCEFCWYQRIAMYPIAVILLVAIVTRGYVAPRYTGIIALIGLGLSIYHYQLQLFPGQGGSCVDGVPCTTRLIQEFDFVSIPFMAGCGFLAILFVRFAEWRADWLREAHDEG